MVKESKDTTLNDFMESVEASQAKRKLIAYSGFFLGYVFGLPAAASIFFEQMQISLYASIALTALSVLSFGAMIKQMFYIDDLQSAQLGVYNRIKKGEEIKDPFAEAQRLILA